MRNKTNQLTKGQLNQLEHFNVDASRRTLGNVLRK
jgi:hypothetical protein